MIRVDHKRKLPLSGIPTYFLTLKQDNEDLQHTICQANDQLNPQAWVDSARSKYLYIRRSRRTLRNKPQRRRLHLDDQKFQGISGSKFVFPSSLVSFCLSRGRLEVMHTYNRTRQPPPYTDYFEDTFFTGGNRQPHLDEKIKTNMKM